MVGLAARRFTGVSGCGEAGTGRQQGRGCPTASNCGLAHDRTDRGAEVASSGGTRDTPHWHHSLLSIDWRDRLSAASVVG